MSTTARIHGLDVLRGIAMILGIFLHASISYKKGYHYGYWVFDETFKSYFFDWLYMWIISFRMQLFFLLAGFFCHMLINKTGLYAFTRNRVKRIFLPLVLAYFTILPLTLFPYLYVEFSKTGDPWPQLKQFFTGFFTLRAHSGFMHLWFLQHLVLFYGITVVLVFLFKGRGWVFLNERGKILWSGPVRFLVFSTLSVAVVSQMFPAPLPSIWTGFVIPVEQLLYYGMFFIFGWILESHRNIFSTFSRNYKVLLITGTLLSFGVLYLLNIYWHPPAFSASHIMLKCLYAVQTMLLISGLLGLFISLFEKQNRFWTYIAQSAYWIYLIHLPIVMITQLLLVHSNVPGVLRFPIVIIVGVSLSFLTYHYFVRYTWIGELLNGKKLSRSFD